MSKPRFTTQQMAAACFILGSLLLRALPRVPALKGRMAPSRVS